MFNHSSICYQCSIPISVEEINSSLKDVDFTGVKPANELLENAAFQFLRE